MWCIPKLLNKIKCESKVNIVEEWEVGIHSMAHSILGVEGRARAPGSRLGIMTKKSITHTNLHKRNNKLVSASLEHFWCIDKPWANMDSQDSSRPGLGRNHHLPPYSILYVWPQDHHPNGILSWDAQVGVLKFPKFGLLQLWGCITLLANLQLRWGLKQSCSPHQELFNDMLHVTCT